MLHRSAHRNCQPLHVLCRIFIILELLAKAASSRVELLTILIPHLSSTLTPPVLPALRKALVQITANDALVQLRAANVFQAVQRILVGVVLHEAEAAGRLGEAVQAHDEALQLAAFGEERVDLLLGGVEGKVADVKGRCVGELFFEVGGGRPRGVGVRIVSLTLLVLRVAKEEC